MLLQLRLELWLYSAVPADLCMRVLRYLFIRLPDNGGLFQMHFQPVPAALGITLFWLVAAIQKALTELSA